MSVKRFLPVRVRDLTSQPRDPIGMKAEVSGGSETGRAPRGRRHRCTFKPDQVSATRQTAFGELLLTTQRSVRNPRELGAG
jgi:hypothetical protein